MAIRSGKIIWEQHKEPALSAPLLEFINPQQTTFTLSENLPEQVEDYSAEDIIAIARTAEIVDESDGKPLYEKLKLASEKRKIFLLIDAVDDEPYLSSKINPLLLLREEVLGGISFCEKVTQVEETQILVYRHISDIESNIPSQIEEYPVARIRGGYPAQPSHYQLKKLQRYPIITISVGAVIHLYRAVTQQKKQTTAFITVHGNAVANPMNLEVSFDMTVAQVLERCGLSQTPTRVVVGGPLTGFAVVDTQRTRMTPTTRGVLAFVRKEQEFRYSCIGCGRCERDCPVGLNPVYIYNFMQAEQYEYLAYFDPQRCIECGLCSYTCPSRLKVSVAVKEAKQLVRSGQVTVPDTIVNKDSVLQFLSAVGNHLATAAVFIKDTGVKVAKATGRGLKKAGKATLAGTKAFGRFVGEKAQQGTAALAEKQEAARLERATKATKTTKATKAEKAGAEKVAQKQEDEKISLATPTAPETINSTDAEDLQALETTDVSTTAETEESSVENQSHTLEDSADHEDDVIHIVVKNRSSSKETPDTAPSSSKIQETKDAKKKEESHEV